MRSKAPVRLSASTRAVLSKAKGMVWNVFGDDSRPDPFHERTKMLLAARRSPSAGTCGHRPPAPGPKHTGNLGERKTFFEPMKGRGADTKIKSCFAKCRILKGRDHDLECFIRVILAKICSQARVRFDGDQRPRTKVKQRAGGCSCAGPNLEYRLAIGQTASFDQCRKDPVRIRRPRRMVARRICSESFATETAGR